jgi:hypothetical protein
MERRFLLSLPFECRSLKKRPNTTPSPQPIVARWGTWLDAANYYYTNYSETEKIFNKLDSKD